MLATAAMATPAVCLDERAGPDGEWERRYLAWTRSGIWKLARRARGAQWRAAQEIDGVTVEYAGAQVRALVPGPVGELDPRIASCRRAGQTCRRDEAGGSDCTGAVV